MAFAQVNKWREPAPSDGGMYELDVNREWHCVWCHKGATKGDGGHLESTPHLKRLGYNGVQLSDAQLRSVGWLSDAATDQLQIADRGSAAAASGAAAARGPPGFASGSTPALDDMLAAGTAPPRGVPPPPPGQQTDGLSGPPPAPAPAAVSEENVILNKLHVKLDIILDKLQSVEARLAEIEQAFATWAWQ